MASKIILVLLFSIWSIRICKATDDEKTCTCLSFMSGRYGNCQKEYKHYALNGKICYIQDKDACSDAIYSGSAKKYFSWEACKKKEIPNDVNKCKATEKGSLPTTKGKGAEGTCVFPFTYGDKKFSSCASLTEYGGVGWCSFDAKYVGKWGYCTEDCPRTCDALTRGSLWARYFRDKGVKKPSHLFTQRGSQKARNGKCKFPFTHKGIKYTSCADKDRYAGLGWCPFDYELKGNRFGYCTRDCPGNATPEKPKEEDVYEEWSCEKCMTTEGYTYCHYDNSFSCLPNVENDYDVPCGDDYGDVKFKTCALCREENVNYKGFGIDGKNPITDVVTADECHKECLLEDECEVWTWKNSNAPTTKNTCWLKSEKGKREEHSGKVQRVTGIKRCGRGLFDKFNCINFHPDKSCEQMTKEGWCLNHKESEWMKKNCFKACGFCTEDYKYWTLLSNPEDHFMQ